MLLPQDPTLPESETALVVAPPDESTVEGIIDDMEDLENARNTPGDDPEHVSFWKILGPGLITGVADDDPSGIGTYSVAGAQYGYGLLWLIPFLLPLMIAVQEMCARIAGVTGEGLTSVIKQYYPRWILWFAVGLLIGANIINIWADFNMMGAAAHMLFGFTFALWVTVVAGVTILLQVFVPYRLYVRFLKWMSLALLAYVVTALLPRVHNDWPRIFRSLVIPSWKTDPTYILTVVGFLGTTISPYLFFWQAAETVEEEVAEGEVVEPGQRVTRLREAEMRMIRADTAVGMTASQLITFFIIICTSATLHARGITDINTAQDAAKALLPLGGAMAYWLFTLGIVGAGLLAVPTLAGSAAYAIAEASGWKYGLYRRFNRARGFYASIIIVLVFSYALNFIHVVSPVKGLLYSAVLNGVAAPPLIVLLLLIGNNPRIVKHRRNGLWSNLFGVIAAILMTAAVVLLVWGLVSGKA